ncbi:MAG: hypothetical protein NTV51_05645 [Verrucomicrobia bacterium]|nr:hypothetical protein [Verrucomicrobiota bacterium]
MGLKIKWNDDRVRGTATALLLIARDRLSRGETADLIRASLADYRRDPADYKLRKAAWPDVREVRPLTDPAQIAQYRKLQAAVDGLLRKFVEGKRQFNSLTELDNFLSFTLGAGPGA